jgi:type IV pilus assembly protein PilV
MQLRRRQSGTSLIEALVAMVIFTVATLGILVLQASMMRHNLNAQVRAQASFLAEQLIGLATADPGNLGCYTVGTPGMCPSIGAGAMVEDWRTSVLQGLPGASTYQPVATFDAATGRFQLTLRWKRESEAVVNNLVVETAIRP